MIDAFFFLLRSKFIIIFDIKSENVEVKKFYFRLVIRF